MICSNSEIIIDGWGTMGVRICSEKGYMSNTHTLAPTWDNLSPLYGHCWGHRQSGVAVTYRSGRTVAAVCSEHHDVGALLILRISVQTEQPRRDFGNPGWDSFSTVKIGNVRRHPNIVENRMRMPYPAMIRGLVHLNHPIKIKRMV